VKSVNGVALDIFK